MTVHMRKHTAEPQKCHQCDKIAPNAHALRLHIGAVHCEAKFECHLCVRKFKLQPALKVYGFSCEFQHFKICFVWD